MLLLGGWLGLGYGFLEAAAVLLLGSIPGVLSWRSANSAQILWFAPLFYGAIGLILGFLFAGLARLVPVIAWDRILVFIAVAGGLVLGAQLPGSVLAGWAVALLAVGAGAQALRIYAARTDTWRGIARRTTVPLLAAVPLIWAALSGFAALGERAALADLPAPDRARPNVLLLLMDTQRGDRLSGYGYHRPTSPRLDSLAGEGLQYDAAYANSSWTLPTHATLFTGALPQEHRAGVIRHPYLDDTLPTLAEELRDEGYATGAFVANGFWVGRQTGLDRGFIRFEDFYGNPGDAVARTALGRVYAYQIRPRLGMQEMLGRKRADEVNGDFLDWLDRVGGERPFFGFINYFDVHGPYLPPAPFDGMFSEDDGEADGIEDRPAEIQIGALGREMPRFTPAEFRRMSDAYDESIRYLDSEIGALIDSLDARGVLDETLVIVTSDHGESFGEHGYAFHGHSLFLDQLRAPLILRFPPAIAPGARISEPVGLERVAPTVALLAGAEDAPFPAPPLPGPWAPAMDSADPAPVIAGVAQRSIEEGDWPSSRSSLSALMTERWHFIRHGDGERFLFDLVEDPEELRNLVEDPRFAELVARFDARLEGLWE